MPDIEDRFYQRFKDRGLVVVGINPGGRGGVQGGPSTDDIGGVQRFTENLGVTFPIGLEQTANYVSYVRNYRGANPFPVDIIADQDGRIVYIAREYEPEAMTALIEELLDDGDAATK
ncbi:MAG: peroxiredoxin family protein [Vicinamibacterales bacterium]